MKILLTFIVGIICLAQHGFGSNILVMLPLPLVSHTNNFMPLFKALAAKGHNVTIVTPFPQKKPVPNLNEIVVPNILQDWIANMPMDKMLEEENFLFKLIGLWMFAENGMRSALEMEKVKKLIEDDNSKFDLVIAETWFIQEPFVAFGHKYNAPVINLMPGMLFPRSGYLIGNQLPTSYSPALMLGYTDHMSFKERAVNFFVNWWDIIAGNLYYLRKQDALMRKYFKYPGSENLPHLIDLLRNTSLTLIDYNHALGYPVPLHKNVVPFGGTNIKNAEKLPPDLQKYMDNAKEGVIYFSLGSVWNISATPQDVQKAIMLSLGKVKQKVLMKLDDPNLLKKYPSGNIETREWFPQSSVLAHPNCKLFITHGGLHGVMEGVYHSVPMVAIPLMADQIHNAKFAQLNGFAVSVDRKTITEQKFLNAINIVLNNPKYKESITRRSAIFKDTPIDILENAIFWIEYVIRHKGAPHLRPAVLDLYWYQHLMLDVVAFYLIVIFLILFIIKKILTMLLRCFKCIFCRKKCSVKKTTKPKKE